MWGIFLESLVILQNYAGYHENGFLFGIFLFVLLYLWLTEKDKVMRALFVYVPVAILLLFFFPIFRKIFVALMDDGETYYRLLWLLQMSVVSAYGAVKLFGRHRRIGLVVISVIIIACGRFVYQSEYITKAQNPYHLPEEAIEVAELIDPEEGWIVAVVPSDLIYYVRQYSSRIRMPYGREMLIARWNFYNELYEAMEETEVMETASFVESAREYGCNYVVLKKERKVAEPLTDYGFSLYADTDNYFIYQYTDSGE